MKISKKSIGESGIKTSEIQTPSWRVEYAPGSHTFRANNGTTVVIEGDLYYYVDKNDKTVRLSADSDAALKRAYDSVGQEGFPERVEGIYNLAVIDENKDSVSVIGDAFNRTNLFYSADEKCPVVSTEFKDILPCFATIEYDQATLTSLILLGYPPMKHTPYRRLHRLSIDEQLTFQNGEIHLTGAKVKSLLSREMGETDLDRYAEILENSILSRSSPNDNWVCVSGGWDSTIILGVLRKFFDASSVHAVVQAFNFSDGRCYNPYEVEKSKEIGKHYGVRVEVVTTDMGDKRLPGIWSDNAPARRTDFVYSWLPAYPIMANLLQQKGKPGAAVFVGSFSDALHNFGFSQYASLPYLNLDFRQYSDKIMSYLYSPTFLKKVIDNTFEDDFAYKLFKWHYANVSFIDMSRLSRDERIFEYLLSFIMSASRLPFAFFDNESILSNNARSSYKEWLYANYFKDPVENIDCENMYFWLIWLYQHFHLQGLEKNAVNANFRASGTRPCWPFYDLRLVRFLQMMPENWGRGLEWRPIKYPLKHYAREKLNIPYKIVESGFHSYIDEVEHGHSIDWRSEIINNSVLTPGTWQNIRSGDKLGQLFDQKWFNISVLNDALQTGKSKSNATALPLNLLAILSTSFEGK